MYDYLIFDIVNWGYKVFNDPDPKENLHPVVEHHGKKVYQRFVSSLMESLRNLEERFLQKEGHAVFLFDNYHSRQELAKMLRPLKISESRKKLNHEYKKGRTNARIEFYNSLDVFRTWSFTAPPRYHSARIENLEADDLVKPCLQHLRRIKADAKVLMITNDSDWCRYLDANTQYLPELHAAPEGVEEFKRHFGFVPTEEKVILYKLLEGDTADHVHMIFPSIPPEERKVLLSRYDSTADLMFSIHGDPEFQKYSTMVKEHEIDIKIAYQVLSAKEVALPHFRRVFTTGRNVGPLQKRWNDLFSPNITQEEPVEFKFGGIKLPRQAPRKEK